MKKMSYNDSIITAKQFSAVDMKAGKTRKNAVMNPFLAKLSEQDMKDLAAYISKL